MPSKNNYLWVVEIKWPNKKWTFCELASSRRRARIVVTRFRNEKDDTRVFDNGSKFRVTKYIAERG